MWVSEGISSGRRRGPPTEREGPNKGGDPSAPSIFTYWNFRTTVLTRRFGRGTGDRVRELRELRRVERQTGRGTNP